MAKKALQYAVVATAILTASSYMTMLRREKQAV
jgi:hypothetical protein